MSPNGILIICGCGQVVCNLPSPDYDNVTSFEIICPNCKGTNVVTTSRGRIAERLYKGILRHDRLVDINMQTEVPEASACIQEAVISVNNDAFRAATVMARAALEVTLEYAGFNADKLYQKVIDAVSTGALLDYDKKRAENIRLIGNFGAHGSCARYIPEDAKMTQPDAKYVVEISAQLIKKLITWKVRRL